MHVSDHCEAILQLIDSRKFGEVFNIGGQKELKNIEIIEAICSLLDQKRPKPNASYSDLITFVTDRPGHDMRYAINPAKIESCVGWRPKVDFNDGISSTIDWYIEKFEEAS